MGAGEKGGGGGGRGGGGGGGGGQITSMLKRCSPLVKKAF